MFRQATSKVALAVATAVLVLLSAHSLNAQTTGSNPPGLCKAGTAALAIGQAGIFVNFPVPWPANVKYSVAVQPLNTGGYSGTTASTYFNVLKKLPNQFQVQHKLSGSGVPVNVTVQVELDWIACPQR
jgi:hypothetical protein